MMLMRAAWRRGAVIPARHSLWLLSPSSKSLATIANNNTQHQEKDAKEKKKKLPEAQQRQKHAAQFALLAPALQVFYTHTGHWVVPFHFPIPAANGIVERSDWHNAGRVAGFVRHASEIPWPEEVRGLNLGRVLDKFMMNADHQARNPRVVDQLQEIDFPAKQSWREYKWKHQLFAALQTFFDLHGHSIVPIKFEVPRTDAQWPVATRGARLGRIVDRLRSTSDKLTTRELADLESIEFSFDAVETTWSDKILPSLEVFAQVYGHCRVEHSFVVPREQLWPTKAWGLKLGSNVDCIRSKKIYVDQVARDLRRLEAINFVWNDSEHRWSEIILPSLQVFCQVYGHCHVPTNFFVPAQAPWPEDAWGVKLGSTVTSLRTDGYYAEQAARDAAELDAIGFVWNPKQDRWENVLLPAFECFHRLHGHLRIPRKFVVPSEASWPEKAWGLKLGLALQNMKSRADYADERERDHARLVAIGFPAINHVK